MEIKSGCLSPYLMQLLQRLICIFHQARGELHIGSRAFCCCRSHFANVPASGFQFLGSDLRLDGFDLLAELDDSSVIVMNAALCSRAFPVYFRKPRLRRAISSSGGEHQAAPFPFKRRYLLGCLCFLLLNCGERAFALLELFL
jgi:hypothetical protein